ncbi:MAG TPA: nucleotidyltransferase family protein [Firmicutes bacterium]|nr:nucleotidyltransferase family protein [Bacillota bacterium]
MKITGIIAEYNPFHKGHQLHIQTARQRGATHVAVVMSGNFVQRGAPALLSKQLRARAALESGADLVLELPLPYACATAQRFAYGGVATLQGLGCVDELFFGSESGNLDLLEQAAQAIDDPRLGEALDPLLDQGMTFAQARQQAVTRLWGEQVGNLLGEPNDILGIEYLRQLRLLGCAIRPAVMERVGPGHDSNGAQGFLTSASQLRSLLTQGAVGVASNYMPKPSAEICRLAIRNKVAPASFYPAERAILARLRTMTIEELSRLPDISEGLENRLYEAIRSATSLEELFTACKTKRYTLSRLRRVVLCAFLGLEARHSQTPPPYIHVLGFTPAGKEILTAARDTCTLPLSHSLAQLRDLGGEAQTFAQLEATATDLYCLMLPQAAPCGLDYTTPLIKVQ